METRRSGFAVLLFILIGQSGALLGAAVCNFALGIWAYESAGSVADFSWIAVASSLPGILLGPFLGVYVDRWNRKSALIWAQIGNTAVFACLAALAHLDMLSVWAIIAVVPVGAVCVAILQLAFSSTISTMVDKDRLSQANAMVGLVFGVIQLAGPLMGGVASDRFSISEILGVTLVAYGIAVASLVVSPIPTPALSANARRESTVMQELAEGYRYLATKPGMLGGLWMFTAIWFSVSVIQILFVPVVLGFGTKSELGMIQTAGGLGLLVGGIGMVVWKGPKRLMHGIAIPCVVVSVAFVFMPLSTSTHLLSIFTLLVMATLPMANAASQTLWQRKTDPAFQGRVFSIRNTIMKAAQPLAFVSAGFLADVVFEPNMQVGAAWSEWFGAYWGTGSGRGAALMMSAFGFISFMVVMAGLANRRIRNADINLPDYQTPTERPPSTN